MSLQILMTLLLLTDIILRDNTVIGFSAVTSPPPRIKDTKVAVEGKSTASVIRPPLPPQSTSAVDDVSLTNYMVRYCINELF